MYQEKGLEKLLENANVEDFVDVIRRVSLEQYDGQSSFENHAAYVEVMIVFEKHIFNGHLLFPYI